MRAVGGVNLSDFCRYYQQPTNNTPELSLQIGSRQQKLLQHWPLVFRFAASLLSPLHCILCCRLYSASLISLHSQWLLHIVISQQSAAILVLFVGRRYHLLPVSRFAAFAVAAKAMVSAIAFMAVHSARVQRPLLSTWCGQGESRSSRPAAMASIRLPGGLYFALFFSQLFLKI